MFDKLKDRLTSRVRLVYPEGKDHRIIGACSRLVKEDLIEGILLGKEEEIRDVAIHHGIDLEGISILDPDLYDKEAMVQELMAIRQGKNTEDEVRAMVDDNIYFATMMVKMGLADGMVAGAVYSTGDTIRPALQIIKTRPDSSRISGSSLMLGPQGQAYLYADMAINIDLDAEGLAEVAKQTADMAQVFGMDPKIAFLSFSTKGSADSEETRKVVKAYEIARDKYPDLAMDGELQFDAAIDPGVAQLKAPDSEVAGQANVFIFPDLNSGNIAYKITERLAGYEAIGPLLQGLAGPINDLSRGCNEEDVYKVSIITALQAQADQ